MDQESFSRIQKTQQLLKIKMVIDTTLRNKEKVISSDKLSTHKLYTSI